MSDGILTVQEVATLLSRGTHTQHTLRLRRGGALHALDEYDAGLSGQPSQPGWYERSPCLHPIVVARANRHCSRELPRSPLL